MSKEKQIEVITYEQDRLYFFVDQVSLAQKKYDRLFKTFKDAPYLSEGAQFLSDAGRELQFYKDVVEMLDKGYRKQSEGEWEEYNIPPMICCSEFDRLEQAYNARLAKDIETNADFVKYAKAEVAREIFEEIERLLDNYSTAQHYQGEVFVQKSFDYELENAIAELKKKHTEGNDHD